jgi:hypothetical protein
VCWWCAGSWCAGRCRRCPGGGTIAFVDPGGALYLDDPVAREEGGTPAIVESVRAGLGRRGQGGGRADRILDLERRWRLRVLGRWAGNPHLEILGHPDAPRLPIVSVRVHRAGRVLHHEYVVALLDDLFGIQARGGCSCAGPYGTGCCASPRAGRRRCGPRPPAVPGDQAGLGQVTFPYFMSEAVVDYVVEAVDLVAEYGTGCCPSTRSTRARVTGGTATPRRRRSRAGRPADRAGPGAAAGWARTRWPASWSGPGRCCMSRPDELADRPSGLPPELEALREFHLPPGCLR